MSDDENLESTPAPKKRGRPRKVTVNLKTSATPKTEEKKKGAIIFDEDGNVLGQMPNQTESVFGKQEEKKPSSLFDFGPDFSISNSEFGKREDTSTSFEEQPQTATSNYQSEEYQASSYQNQNYQNQNQNQGYTSQGYQTQQGYQAGGSYQSQGYQGQPQATQTYQSQQNPQGSSYYQRRSTRTQYSPQQRGASEMPQSQGRYTRGARLKPQPQQYNNTQAEESEDPNAPVLLVNTLNVLSLQELRTLGVEQYNINPENVFDLKKQELICEILKSHAYAGGVIHTEGTLEVLQDGYGFLRSELNSYLSGPEDVFVSPQIIKSYALRTGDTVYGMLRNPKAAERFFAVVKVLKVNGADPQKTRTRIPFDSLTPLYPNELINLETKEEDISMRVINLFDPIGKGQRALITAPPRTGKTILLQKIANAITTNHPEIVLMVLLVDERPEEVTDMRRSVKGEVVASTFDEQATRHVQVAEMVIEKAKRLVEYGKDVVILLDSITRLARAYNQTVPASGKILSGGVDSNALHKPKRFFGAARNIENGGSLTIIASALIETGSRMDEVIFEEFKGTGNCEMVLDRKMADKRLFPAINLKKSGTRREDLIVDAATLAKIYALRSATGTMEDVEMTEFVLDKMKKTVNNKAFIDSMGMGDSIK